MISDCPSCGTALYGKANYCKGCGWKQAASQTVFDPKAHCCAWTSGRDRCHYPGTMTHGGGAERRWYCSGHIDCSQQMGAQIVEMSHRQIPSPDYSFDARKAQAEMHIDERWEGYVAARLNKQPKQAVTIPYQPQP